MSMDLSSNKNEVRQRKVKMFFFPFMAGISHAYPMIHAARFFARHPDVQVTIITSSKNVQTFTNAINRDRADGYEIGFHVVELPKAEVGLPVDIDHILTSTSNVLKFKLFKALGMLKDPLLALLHTHRPDCLVSDILTPWTLDIASEMGIPRLGFHVSSIFGICTDDSLKRFKPHESVKDDEPFVLPGLPDKVSFTRSRIPNQKTTAEGFVKAVVESMEKSYGIMANSFYDMESGYVEYCKNVMGKRLCLVGPVCQYSKENNSINSKNVTQDEENIVAWLESKEPDSVTYVSFGSVYASLCKEQFHEIAHGLEASGHPFIWVARANLSGDQGEEGWFPDGFEERVKLSNQGLIIKQWAPQQAILSHSSVGAFVTQCGWNSCLEGVSYGLPFITWPLGVEQFFQESLIVDVLRVGIRVGNEEWMPENAAPKVTVTRDKVEAAVRQMMSCGEEVVKMRKRLRQLAKKAGVAVQPGGSSHHDVQVLVEELKARQISSTPQSMPPITNHN